jgi:predicted RNase H-like HicB family nuclease
MILDLIVTKTSDGYTAEVPSIKGCETWAHDEETVIEKIFEMTSYYLHLDAKNIKLDKARIEENKTIYKLIFHK